jgi:endonuclease YncB( thermonuclease family)
MAGLTANESTEYWEYRHVTVDRVIDGDTVELTIDMGNRTYWKEHFRLYGIDTPETKKSTKKQGIESTEHLRWLLSTGIDRIRTYKPDKFGRTLVRIWVAQLDGDTGTCEDDVATILINAGMGRPYFGGKK